MADYNLDHIPGAGWITDDQGNKVLDLGADTLHGNGLLGGLLANYYNQPIAQDATNTQQEQSPGLYDVPSMAKEDAINTAMYVKSHPGEVLASAAAPILGPVEAAAAGTAGYMFDSYHPFSAETPDYKTLSPEEYIGRGLLAGLGSASAARFERPAITYYGVRGFLPDEPETQMKTGFVGPSSKTIPTGEDMGFWPAPPPTATPVTTPEIQAPNLNISPKPLIIPAEDVGGVPGYHVINYDAIPGASEVERQLLDEGKPRLVPSSSTSNKFFGDLLVGNKDYTQDIRTEEGKRYAAQFKDVDPSVQRNLFSGVSPKTFDPDKLSTTIEHPGNPNKDYMLHGDEELDYKQDPVTGLWYKPKWMTNKTMGAESYSHPILETPQYGDAIKVAIQSGQITEDNLPKNFNSLNDLMDFADTYRAYDSKGSDIQTVYNNIFRGDPRLQGQYATYEVAIKNPRVIDKQGQGWHKALPDEPEYVPGLRFEQGGHGYQNMQIENAEKAGHDAVIYKNQVDPGNLTDQVYKWADPEKYAGSILPQNVHVLFNLRQAWYPESYMWRNSMRPLAAVPVAGGAGLAAGLGDNQ